MKWTLEDFTKKNGGFIRILCDGERAADVFPFAQGVNEEHVRRRAQYMVDVLNDAKVVLT